MKNYAVVLFEWAADELHPWANLWLHRQTGLSYFYSPRIEPNGPYFHMVLIDRPPAGNQIEFEMQIPHAFVKAVFNAADLKRIGFTAP